MTFILNGIFIGFALVLSALPLSVSADEFQPACHASDQSPVVDLGLQSDLPNFCRLPFLLAQSAPIQGQGNQNGGGRPVRVRGAKGLVKMVLFGALILFSIGGWLFQKIRAAGPQ